MNGADILEAIRTVADVFIGPLCWVMWNVQGRLSRIEGMLAQRKRQPTSHGDF
jgi:hypothetical protein